MEENTTRATYDCSGWFWFIMGTYNIFYLASKPLRGTLRKKGSLIGDFDLLIASTALYRQIPLCTNNRKHYERIEGLEIFSV